MSTETIPAPGTPGTETAAPVITKTAKEMTAAAFNEPAPMEPAKPAMPAKAAPVVKTEAKAETAKVESVVKTDAKTDAPAEWPGEKMELPANASKEQVQNFASMKAKFKEDWIKENRARADAEKKLSIYSTAAPADAEAIAAKEARLKAAEDRLAILDVQSSPEFVRQFVQPKEKALATVAEVMGYQTTPKETGDLAALLGKPMKDFNAAVSEFTKDMNSADAATVAQSLREARTLHAQEQGVLAQSKDFKAKLQAKTAQQQKQAFEEVATTFTTALKRIEVTDIMDAEVKQAAVAYNQRLDGLRAAAEKRAFGPITERDVAAMAFDSEQMALMRDHVIPGLEKRFEAQNKVIADLTAQLGAVKGVRSSGPPVGDTSQTPAKQTREQMVAAAFPNERH